MSMNLNQDFKEFLAFLNSNEVEYLVIGGYAVTAHGHPRYTKDIDIWVRPSEQNSKNRWAATASSSNDPLKSRRRQFGQLDRAWR